MTQQSITSQLRNGLTTGINERTKKNRASPHKQVMIDNRKEHICNYCQLFFTGGPSIPGEAGR